MSCYHPTFRRFHRSVIIIYFRTPFINDKLSSKSSTFKDVHIDLILASTWLKLAGNTNSGAKKSFLTSRIMSDKKTDSFEKYRFSAASSCLHQKFMFELFIKFSVSNYPYTLSLSWIGQNPTNFFRSVKYGIRWRHPLTGIQTTLSWNKLTY